MPYFDSKTEMTTVNEGMFRNKLLLLLFFFFFWSEIAGISPNRHRKRHNAYPPILYIRSSCVLSLHVSEQPRVIFTEQ
jgi:hypothetical protein